MCGKFDRRSSANSFAESLIREVSLKSRWKQDEKERCSTYISRLLWTHNCVRHCYLLRLWNLPPGAFIYRRYMEGRYFYRPYNRRATRLTGRQKCPLAGNTKFSSIIYLWGTFLRSGYFPDPGNANSCLQIIDRRVRFVLTDHFATVVESTSRKIPNY